MDKLSAFERFAPAILHVYRRDRDANAVTPFMLSLERLGKASLIEEYWQVFLLFGAAIQMIDDWTDLEKDLAAGHYSYLTLGFENMIRSEDSKRTAKMLRSDLKQVRETHNCSTEFFNDPR